MSENSGKRPQITHLRRSPFTSNTLCGVTIRADLLVAVVGSEVPIVRLCGQCVSRYHRIQDRPMRFGDRQSY